MLTALLSGLISLGVWILERTLGHFGFSFWRSAPNAEQVAVNTQRKIDAVAETTPSQAQAVKELENDEG